MDDDKKQTLKTRVMNFIILTNMFVGGCWLGMFLTYYIAKYLGWVHD